MAGEGVKNHSLTTLARNDARTNAIPRFEKVECPRLLPEKVECPHYVSEEKCRCET